MSQVTYQPLLRRSLWVMVTFVSSGVAMLVKHSLSLWVETNVRVGIWSTCFLNKCYRWKHCHNIIVVSIVASNVSSYGVIICTILHAFTCFYVLLHALACFYLLCKLSSSQDLVVRLVFLLSISVSKYLTSKEDSEGIQKGCHWQLT